VYNVQKELRHSLLPEGTQSTKLKKNLAHVIRDNKREVLRRI
jgi:hypothetical protein